MRFVIALLVAFGLAAGAATPALAGAADSGYSMSLDQQQAPSGQLDVDINTNEGGGAWYMSPLWIGVGLLALVLLIVLIAAATRGGGGTTVIKD